ncbi:unnamed protein product [Rhizoctonia solani]|uniref:Uncharacterized protein n=1 Tax=Rhizoctonia solani TaxID=456999 RepID=A0A8H3D806_9AGAM|nr:unnamed protein product [Rhizoctonia solani]
MPRSTKVTPKASEHEWHCGDADDDGIQCIGVNLPGVYSTFPTNKKELPTESTRAESGLNIQNVIVECVSPEPTASLANVGNTALCLVTQDDFPLVSCPVLQLLPGDNIVSRLAYAWGSDSAKLDFDLKNSSFNRITLLENLMSRFGSVYGGHWAIVPDIRTLGLINGAAKNHSSRRPPLYLEDFPNAMRWYEYVPLRGNLKVIVRFDPGAETNAGPPVYGIHEFPFLNLRFQSTVHPYFVIVNTAQKAMHARAGRSHIPYLPAQQQHSLDMCIDIYKQWLKNRAGGASNRAHH